MYYGLRTVVGQVLQGFSGLMVWTAWVKNPPYRRRVGWESMDRLG
jgi:hypothetical protein